MGYLIALEKIDGNEYRTHDGRFTLRFEDGWMWRVYDGSRECDAYIFKLEDAFDGIAHRWFVDYSANIAPLTDPEVALLEVLTRPRPPRSIDKIAEQLTGTLTPNELEELIRWTAGRGFVDSAWSGRGFDKLVWKITGLGRSRLMRSREIPRVRVKATRGGGGRAGHSLSVTFEETRLDEFETLDGRFLVTRFNRFLREWLIVDRLRRERDFVRDFDIARRLIRDRLRDEKGLLARPLTKRERAVHSVLKCVDGPIELSAIVASLSGGTTADDVLDVLHRRLLPRRLVAQQKVPGFGWKAAHASDFVDQEAAEVDRVMAIARWRSLLALDGIVNPLKVPPDLLELLAKEIYRLAGSKDGIAESAFRYVLDGAPERRALKAVASKCCYEAWRESVPIERASDQTIARERFFARTELSLAPLYLRLAKLYSVVEVRGEDYRYHLRPKIRLDGSTWLDPIIRVAFPSARHRRFEPNLSSEILEEMLTLAGRPPDSLVRAALIFDNSNYGESSHAELLSRVPGFGEAVARHESVLHEALTDDSLSRSRNHPLSLIEDVPIGPFAARLVELACLKDSEVRAMAAALLARDSTPAIPFLEQMGMNRSVRVRSRAVALLIELGGKTAKPALRRLLKLERAESVRRQLEADLR